MTVTWVDMIVPAPDGVMDRYLIALEDLPPKTFQVGEIPPNASVYVWDAYHALYGPVGRLRHSVDLRRRQRANRKRRRR